MQAHYGSQPPAGTSGAFYGNPGSQQPPHPYAMWAGQPMVPYGAPHGAPFYPSGIFAPPGHSGPYPYGTGPSSAAGNSVQRPEGDAGDAADVSGKSSNGSLSKGAHGGEGQSPSLPDQNHMLQLEGQQHLAHPHPQAVDPAAHYWQHAGVPMAAAPMPVPVQDMWMPQPGDEREVKRQRRKQSNRESARRSRLRKQSECEDLGKRVDQLNDENKLLRDEITRLHQACATLTDDKTALEALMQGLEGKSIFTDKQESEKVEVDVKTENA